MSGAFLISKEDWSLHRKGHMDQERHKEKVRQAIKDNLADLVAEESIIMSDGQKVVKLPIRSLEEYRFRFNPDKQNHSGTGSGSAKSGDVLGSGSDRPQGTGKAPGAGDEPGVDYYEAEITIDELAEMIFADLSLPNLKDKEAHELTAKRIHFTDVRKKGLVSNLDKRRTILAAIKRNAREGTQEIGIGDQDLRFKTWEERPEPYSNAVVLAMMDTSGSMGTFEKYIARSFYFWMVRFLRTRYDNVEIIFLAHDTRAREVAEEEFFTKGESGGTKCSSVYELALNIVEERYPPARYNVYPFHFSDGDNFPSDNNRCINLIEILLERCNALGYGEIINTNYYHDSSLMHLLEKIKHPLFTQVTIRDKNEVYPALKAFFHERKGAAR